MPGFLDMYQQGQPIQAGPQGSYLPGAEATGGPLDQYSRGNLLDQARSQYPILKNYDYGYAENFRPGGGFLEHWGPGESGAAPTASTPLDGLRPSTLPLDRHGIEVRDPKTRPIDVLGDIVSHHMVNTDPVVKQTYETLQSSMTPKQQAMMQDQYEYAQKNSGEKRSFEEWKDASGMPAFLRGYAFQQWPHDFNQRAYTPDQMKMLDGMMNYLRGNGASQGYLSRSVTGY